MYKNQTLNKTKFRYNIITNQTGKLEFERKGSYRAHVELISRLHELTVRSQCAHGAP